MLYFYVILLFLKLYLTVTETGSFIETQLLSSCRLVHIFDIYDDLLIVMPLHGPWSMFAFR